jgi:predicted acyltransferase
MSIDSRTPAGRLVSLDAYRGFIMLAMVTGGLGMAGLRSNPQWGWLAHQLDHVRWDEPITFWDLIQPSFMFMVGASMPFAFAKRVERGESWLQQFRHVVKRCLLLCLIGIVMDSYNEPRPVIQFIRVLQQIAIGYFVAFFFLSFGWKGQLFGVVLLLGAHTAAYLIDAGGAHAYSWGHRDSNVGRKLDLAMHRPFAEAGYHRVLMPSRNFYVHFNAISAAATILIGVIVGEILRSAARGGIKVVAIAALGGVLFAAGWLLTPYVPMVKKLWSASFALHAAGWTCWMMAFFYLVIDVVGFSVWSFPFVVVGVNSIFIYFNSGVLTPTLRSLVKPFTEIPFKELGPWGPVALAALITFLQWLLCLFLYRHRVFFKV